MYIQIGTDTTTGVLEMLYRVGEEGEGRYNRTGVLRVIQGGN